MSSTERDITAQGFSLLQILVEVTVIVPHRPPTISLPHWVISNASTTTYAPLEAGFCWPVTSIVRVWPVAARLVALKTTVDALGASRPRRLPSSRRCRRCRPSGIVALRGRLTHGPRGRRAHGHQRTSPRLPRGDTSNSHIHASGP